MEEEGFYSDEYLAANPHIEQQWWAEWIEVVCGWDKIPKPTQEEWALLRKDFYPGIMPITSVAQLKKMREKQI